MNHIISYHFTTFQDIVIMWSGDTDDYISLETLTEQPVPDEGRVYRYILEDVQGNIATLL